MNWNPLNWLEDAVSWVLVMFHNIWKIPLGRDSGVAWALSIIGLVVVIRIMLIPLFVKQIKSQRNLQILQPKMKEIQKKYAGDREKQSQEMMKLYKDTGTNPLASCLPILVQAPFFYALFQVLQGIAQLQPKGVMTQAEVISAHFSTLFGVPIYATFTDADQTPNPLATKILTAIMIALMTATTFTTQRQLMVKNTAKGNPMAQQQKILLYVFPLFFAITGIHFPVGVLLYWLTTNLWSMGQQFYVIRNNPQPGTPAYDAWEARQRKKREAKDGPDEPEPVAAVVRVQPKKQSRAQRRAAEGAGAATATSASGTTVTADPLTTDPVGTDPVTADPVGTEATVNGTPAGKPPPRAQPKKQSRNQRKK